MELLSNEQMAELSVSTKNVPEFSLEGRRIMVKVVDVYDGDTFQANLWLAPNMMVRMRCRADGYDCAEMKPRASVANRDEIKARAVAARDRFRDLVRYGTDELVTLQCKGFDKYGRLLCDIFVNGLDESINQMMINEQHGYVYNGGTKEAGWG